MINDLDCYISKVCHGIKQGIETFNEQSTTLKAGYPSSVEIRINDLLFTVPLDEVTKDGKIKELDRDDFEIWFAKGFPNFTTGIGLRTFARSELNSDRYRADVVDAAYRGWCGRAQYDPNDIDENWGDND